MRRWPVAVLAVLAALALACESGADGAPPKPPPGSRPPSSMAALGDSISAGYGSCPAVVACHRNSWSTGSSTRVDSHYRRILRDNPRIRGDAHTFARAGARAGQLRGQARAAVSARVGYVTVLVGANDACRDRLADMTAPDVFRQQVDAALTVLRTGLPDARVLVVAIPDLYRLWQIGHTDRRAVRAWSLGVCPTLLDRAASTAQPDADRRAAVRERIDDYNRELRGACADYGSRCRYESAAHRVRFTLDLVNRLDYFHPNVTGQNRLAEATWPRRPRW